MSEIPKGAIEKARSIIAAHPVTSTVPESVYLDVARFIADVSEKAKAADETLEKTGSLCQSDRQWLQSLILPNPEDDLLKEAREICAGVAEKGYSALAPQYYRDGKWDTTEAMQCTLAALKGRK